MGNLCAGEANASEEELSVAEKEGRRAWPEEARPPGWAEAGGKEGNRGEMGRGRRGPRERVLTRPAVQCAQARSVVPS